MALTKLAKHVQKELQNLVVANWCRKQTTIPTIQKKNCIKKLCKRMALTKLANNCLKTIANLVVTDWCGKPPQATTPTMQKSV